MVDNETKKRWWEEIEKEIKSTELLALAKADFEDRCKSMQDIPFIYSQQGEKTLVLEFSSHCNPITRSLGDNLG